MFLLPVHATNQTSGITYVDVILQYWLMKVKVCSAWLLQYPDCRDVPTSKVQERVFICHGSSNGNKGGTGGAGGGGATFSSMLLAATAG